MRNKRLIYSVGLFLFLGLGFSFAKTEIWVSSVGSEINARFIQKISGEYWLLGENKKIYKVPPEQLSDDSRRKAERMSWGAKEGAIRMVCQTRVTTEFTESGFLYDIADGNPKSFELLEDILKTQVKSLLVKGNSLQEVADAAIGFLKESSQKDYDFEDRTESEKKVSITLRNLELDRVLDFVCKQSGCSVIIEEGRIIFMEPKTVVIDPKDYNCSEL